MDGNKIIKDKKLLDMLIFFQKSEITEYYIYSKLAKREKNQENKAVLQQIANEEKGHAEFFKFYTEKEVKPNKFKIFFFYIISVIFGLTFATFLTLVIVPSLYHVLYSARVSMSKWGKKNS
jgi:rubrerythrin